MDAELLAIYNKMTWAFIRLWIMMYLSAGWCITLLNFAGELIPPKIWMYPFLKHAPTHRRIIWLRFIWFMVSVVAWPIIYPVALIVRMIPMIPDIKDALNEWATKDLLKYHDQHHE